MRVLMSGIALLVIFFLPAAVLVSMEIRLSKKKPALLGLIPRRCIFERTKAEAFRLILLSRS